MVEKRKWLSKDRFVKIMAFCHMLPGPEALQLAIYVGYLKRKLWGGILAGLTFIIPGAVVMIILSWLYVTYGSLPQLITQGLLDNRFSGSVSGYNFTVDASSTDYTVSARPSSANAGRFGYYSLPDAVIRYSTTTTSTCTPCYPGSLSGNPVQ